MLARLSGLDVERFVALVLAIFAVAELTQALQLPLSEEFTLGPGAMPLIYGVGLLIFAVALGLTASPKERALPERPDERMDEPGRNYPAGIVTFLLIIFFVASIYVVGFLAGTIIFSFLHLVVVMRLSLLKSAAFSVLWGGGLYYLFQHLLALQLEQGMLFGG
jgi:hypothetical protein